MSKDAIRDEANAMLVNDLLLGVPRSWDDLASAANCIRLHSAEALGYSAGQMDAAIQSGDHTLISDSIIHIKHYGKYYEYSTAIYLGARAIIHEAESAKMIAGFEDNHQRKERIMEAIRFGTLVKDYRAGALNLTKQVIQEKGMTDDQRAIPEVMQVRRVIKKSFLEMSGRRDTDPQVNAFIAVICEDVPMVPEHILEQLREALLTHRASIPN